MARRRKGRSPVVAEEFGIEAKQDSSWTAPLTILGVTLLISFGFLYRYFGPTLTEIRGDTPDPSASDVPIVMDIGRARLIVPTNFTRFPRARRDGPRDSVALYSLLPEFEAFTVEKAAVFDSNSPDSPVIYFDISNYSSALSEVDRLEKVYKEKIVDPQGRDGPYGLTVYEFAQGTGYDHEDLFVFYEEGKQPVVLICDEETDVTPSPNCRRAMRLNETLSLSYRYKRPWLAQWRSIDLSIQELVNSFIVDDEGG